MWGCRSRTWFAYYLRKLFFSVLTVTLVLALKEPLRSQAKSMCIDTRREREERVLGESNSN